jgi:hypothetical protein
MSDAPSGFVRGYHLTSFDTGCQKALAAEVLIAAHHGSRTSSRRPPLELLGSQVFRKRVLARIAGAVRPSRLGRLQDDPGKIDAGQVYLLREVPVGRHSECRV